MLLSIAQQLSALGVIVRPNQASTKALGIFLDLLF
jgi:hypothetical protein